MLQPADVHSHDALQAAVRAFTADRPQAGLLFAQGADYEVLGPGTRLDRHVLDAMCPDGLATGELREKFALLPVLDLRTSGGREMLGMSGIEPPVPPKAAEWREDVDVLKAGLRFCAARSITAIHNMDGNRHLLELLRSVEQEGDLIARVSVPFHYTREMPLSELDRASAMAADFTGQMLTSNGVKIFVDGVIESGTAAMLAEYADRPGHCGMQITVHAIGDAAVRIALDGYQAARVANGPRDSRHRIEHIGMIAPSDVPHLAELGVIASIQPLNAPQGESPTTRSIGPQRAAQAYPWRDLQQAGALVAFSSDWPILPVDPLLGIQTALMHQPHLPGLPDQRLSLMDVLKAVTYYGAFAGFMETQTGTIRAIIIRADLGPAMFPIIGGQAQGGGWTARILPGGADFALGLPDGSYAIEARYCLELDDGTPVMVTNAGRMAPQPDGGYLGRTRAVLEVPDGPHRVLGQAVFFGTALAEPGDTDHVYIELWEAPV